MAELCKRCKLKPSLTKCIQGNLCHQCGNSCHPKYQHPVEFIRRSTHTQSAKNTPKPCKSMLILTNTNIPRFPSRKTKIPEMKSVRRNESNNKTIVNNNKKEHFVHQKQNVPDWTNRSRVLLIKEMKKSVGVMTDQYEYNHELKLKQSKRQQSNMALIDSLREQIEKKDKLVTMLSKKVKELKESKCKTMKNYEQKLKMIRKLRQ